MKITKSKLKQIIKEELQAVLDEWPPPADMPEYPEEEDSVGAPADMPEYPDKNPWDPATMPSLEEQ